MIPINHPVEWKVVRVFFVAQLPTLLQFVGNPLITWRIMFVDVCG